MTTAKGPTIRGRTMADIADDDHERTAAPWKAKPTWEDIVALCPELLRIEADIRDLSLDRPAGAKGCGVVRWYGYDELDADGLLPPARDRGFKGRMYRLVGWYGQGDARLLSRTVYSLVYDHLDSLLPPCRVDDPECGYDQYHVAQGGAEP